MTERPTAADGAAPERDDPGRAGYSRPGEIDLLVVTDFLSGDEPPVDRLRYVGPDDATGWHGDVFRHTTLEGDTLF